MLILDVQARTGESCGIQVRYVKCHLSCQRTMLSMKFLLRVVAQYGLLLLQGQDYLLVGDQFLYFGEALPNSLLNPNQLRAFGVEVYDNPFDESQDIGMDCRDIFIPLHTIVSNVYFESRVPTDWEVKHLPRIYITSDHWDPTDDCILPECKSRKHVKMHAIKSMTSGMTR